MQVKRLGQSVGQGIAKEISITDRESQRERWNFSSTTPFLAALSRAAKLVSRTSGKRALTAFVVAVVVLAGGRGTAFLAQPAQDAAPATQSAPLTADALDQLVAPIALYPDALVAQILAASTYPTQIVEADRWLQKHSKSQDEKLAKEVDKESWDPSIKALTAFPSVLANLDTNLSWTSALGDAYFNQQQDVLDAVQVMRARAKSAGQLESNTQETVTSQGPTIIIEPADPDVCYLPSYNPWLVYGAPIGIYPGYFYDGFIDGPYVSFGLGIGIGGGFWDGFGWGWGAWGFNWRDRAVIFNHDRYISRSPTFFHRFPGGDRGNLGRGPDRSAIQGNHQPGDAGRNRGGAVTDRNSDRSRTEGVPNDGISHDRGGIPQTGNQQSRRDYRGFGEPGTSTRSGAFSGFGQGGIERGSSSRGRASFGGGGGSAGGRSGGGGGGRGGGGRGGGRH